MVAAVVVGVALYVLAGGLFVIVRRTRDGLAGGFVRGYLAALVIGASVCVVVGLAGVPGSGYIVGAILIVLALARRVGRAYI